MPGSESNSVSSHEEVINDTSDVSEMKLSDEEGSVGKGAMAVPEKNGYRDSVYANAAQIFQGIRTAKPEDRTLLRYGGDSPSPVLTWKDEHSQRASYKLAFNALKYQDILEEILLDSSVYPCQSIPDELTSLLVVMLHDLQDRKFQAREIFDEEEPIAEVKKIEHYLYSFRTKLAAALARYRIKHDALSIEHVLPETIRKQEQRASALPLCVWINTFKTSLQDVFGDLKKEGFTRVASVSDFNHYTYCVDQHCHDVLFFPSSHKEELLHLDLFADCKLLLQDKSRSLAVHSAQALLRTEDDVIVAHVGSHLTIAHMSALTIHTLSRIFVCGVKSSAKEAELRNLFSHMGCKNIQLLHEDFTEIEPTDLRLEKGKVVLLLPQCSGLGVGNPIDFILNERGDAGLLRDIFQGSVSEDKLRVLAERQLCELMHAMTFNNVQGIVYCTCSIYPEENELVVKKALESGVEGNKVQSYRLIPPVFSTCSNQEASTDIFFKIEPSEISSGCFLAILEREKCSSENMSVGDILACAAAKGPLDGSVEKLKKEKKKQKATQRRWNITGSGREPKTAQVLHHVKAEVPMSRAVSNVQQKSVNRGKPRAEVKNSTKPLSEVVLPKAPRRMRPVPAAGEARDRRPPASQARAERRRLVLNPVQIVFPPVVTPYLSSQGNPPRTTAAHHCFHDWTAARASSGGKLPPSLPEAVKPPVLRHPRPWRQCSCISSTFRRKDVNGMKPAAQTDGFFSSDKYHGFTESGKISFSILI